MVSLKVPYVNVVREWGLSSWTFSLSLNVTIISGVSVAPKVFGHRFGGLEVQAPSTSIVFHQNCFGLALPRLKASVLAVKGMSLECLLFSLLRAKASSSCT